MSSFERVKTALVENGESLTAKQIAARYNVANPRDVIYNLRTSGYPIYLDKFVDSKGKVTFKYQHGTPSRAVIAAGYKALAAGFV